MGRTRSEGTAAGRPPPVNDTWIAACCLVDDVPLLTLNRADFEDYSRHDRLHLVGGRERLS